MIDFQYIYEVDVKNIDLKRIYDCINGESISFEKESFKNYYFSLSEEYGWFEKSKNDINGMDLLFNYEKLFEKIIDYKREIELNNSYFREYSDDEFYNSNIKNKLEFQLNKVKKIFVEVNSNFIKEFTNFVYDNLNEFIFVNEGKNYDYLQKKVDSLGKKNTKDIFQLKIYFSNLKNSLKSIHLLDESTIINNLNPNRELLFQLMNK